MCVSSAYLVDDCGCFPHERRLPVLISTLWGGDFFLSHTQQQQQQQQQQQHTTYIHTHTFISRLCRVTPAARVTRPCDESSYLTWMSLTLTSMFFKRLVTSFSVKVSGLSPFFPFFVFFASSAAKTDYRSLTTFSFVPRIGYAFVYVVDLLYDLLSRFFRFFAPSSNFSIFFSFSFLFLRRSLSAS